ncbi:MAG: carboxypeptidase regulatory-like domain-containing protein, partial [Acidobacteriota bacterium]
WRALCIFGLLTALAYGQAQVSSGDIKGTVVDASGGVLANVKITAADPDRGLTRTAQSDSEGAYILPLLPPGTYRLRFEAQGFSTKVVEGVGVRVGDTLVLRTEMAVGAIATEVNVTADPPVIDPARTQQANTIESMRIEKLPINRRNYLDFALLAPGVVETNDMVDGTDYRVVQTPQSGLSFGGSNGRGNAVAIDGIENYYSSGGVRPSISQEAVQEFQINRNSFSAEFGNASGGVINIVSKSGTNEFRGNLFGFLRHRDIQARNYFDPGKSAFTRGQYGATAGGPLAKDKTFLFGAFERLDRHETAFVPILQDRSAFTRMTPSQQQLADFFDASGSAQLRGLSAAMKQNLIPSGNPRTMALFNQNSGNFPFSEDSSQLSLRLDHHASDRHHLFVRGNLTDNFSQNAQFGALIAFNRGRSLGVLDAGLMVNHTWLASSNWVVETRLAYSYNKLDVQPTDRFGPEINISGYGFFGREIFLPSTTYERHFQ